MNMVVEAGQLCGPAKPLNMYREEDFAKDKIKNICLINQIRERLGKKMLA